MKPDSKADSVRKITQAAINRKRIEEEKLDKQRKLHRARYLKKIEKEREEQLKSYLSDIYHEVVEWAELGYYQMAFHGDRYGSYVHSLRDVLRRDGFDVMNKYPLTVISWQ